MNATYCAFVMLLRRIFCSLTGAQRLDGHCEEKTRGSKQLLVGAVLK
jgi:hypothetical protein